MLKVSVYGLGNFGYAILKHLDTKSDLDVSLHAYDRNKKLIQCLSKKKKHLFLHKQHKISTEVIFERNVKDLVINCDVLILAVPSYTTREVIRKIKNHINKKIIIVNTAKAIDHKTGKRLSELISQEMLDNEYHYALLAGGTIARDLFLNEPLGMDIACENKIVAKKLTKLFQAPNLSVYPTTDLVGTEYASAFKNVISILAGMIQGMNFSYGSETHIISKIAYEIEKIVVNRFGGKKETFSMKSQCWGNDLWLSCTGKTRNKEFGVLLGKGISVEDAIKEMMKQGKTIEGLYTIRVLNRIVDSKAYPLLNFLYEFISTKSVGLERLRNIIYSHNY